MAYPDAVKETCITAYRDLGLSARQVAELYDVDHTTVLDWAKGERINSHPTLGQTSTELKQRLDERAEQLAHLFLDGVTPEKVAKQSATGNATGFAILVDKMRLLREQPTVIHRTTEERRTALIALLTNQEQPAEQSTKLITTENPEAGVGEPQG